MGVLRCSSEHPQLRGDSEASGEPRPAPSTSLQGPVGAAVPAGAGRGPLRDLQLRLFLVPELCSTAGLGLVFIFLLLTSYSSYF